MRIRTRYAPSPTGFFHIGGARTALYNYLYSKHFNGDFIVRIEDTDYERNVENGTESQLDNLAWLGILPDESPLKPGEYGPYKQTEKLARYEKLTDQLVEQGDAYYCFCSKQLLDQDRVDAERLHQTPKYNRRCFSLTRQQINENLKNRIPFTIRLKIDPQASYSWEDTIRGLISIPGEALTDPVILKSNKVAMYNFAVVVDDYDMCITHVLRGEEHISNTPYQIAIKQALKFDDKPIHYGHLSVIINEDGKKLSKRDTRLKQFIGEYNEMGYLPQAIVNFLALLGWSPVDNKEVLMMDELIQRFEINSVNKSPATFDIVKMNWVSNQHFKLLTDEQYLEFVRPFVKSTNPVYKKHGDELLMLFKSQLSYATEIDELIEDLFGDGTIDDTTLEDIKNCKANYCLIEPILTKSLAAEFDSVDACKALINEIKNTSGLKGKDLFMTTRVLCTNKMHGPELPRTLFLLGKEKIISNIQKIKNIYNV